MTSNGGPLDIEDEEYPWERVTSKSDLFTRTESDLFAFEVNWWGADPNQNSGSGADAITCAWWEQSRLEWYDSQSGKA